jgi:hypothetical protein
MKNITIIASESAEGFNYCTTEFNGEIEETGYTLYHYYDQTEKISRLTAGGNYRSLWANDNEIEVYDDHRGTVEDYYDLMDIGYETDVEHIYTYINGEWMVTNRDQDGTYKPFINLKEFFAGQPFHR